jgi:hypothetical protein
MNNLEITVTAVPGESDTGVPPDSAIPIQQFGIQRKAAKRQRRKDNTAKPERGRLAARAHQSVQPKSVSKRFQNPCVLALASLLNRYGLAASSRSQPHFFSGHLWSSLVTFGHLRFPFRPGNRSERPFFGPIFDRFLPAMSRQSLGEGGHSAPTCHAEAARRWKLQRRLTDRAEAAARKPKWSGGGGSGDTAFRVSPESPKRRASRNCTGPAPIKRLFQTVTCHSTTCKKTLPRWCSFAWPTSWTVKKHPLLVKKRSSFGASINHLRRLPCEPGKVLCWALDWIGLALARTASPLPLTGFMINFILLCVQFQPRPDIRLYG